MSTSRSNCERDEELNEKFKPALNDMPVQPRSTPRHSLSSPNTDERVCETFDSESEISAQENTTREVPDLTKDGALRARCRSDIQQLARVQGSRLVSRPMTNSSCLVAGPPPSRHSSLRLTQSVLEETQDPGEADSPVLFNTMNCDAAGDCTMPATIVCPSPGPENDSLPKYRDGPDYLGVDEHAGALSCSKLPTREPTAVSFQDRPWSSLTRLSSLDKIMTYREEKAESRRASSVLSQNGYSFAMLQEMYRDHTVNSSGDGSSVMSIAVVADYPSNDHTWPSTNDCSSPLEGAQQRSRFRHHLAEIGFCFTIAMTQLLAEYLISGFAIALPSLMQNSPQAQPGSLGLFWPASLLSLIVSATLLIFARLSDMYGGYPWFMFGVIWLSIWTLLPGFFPSSVVLDISRAMQGLAIAAFTPSTFVMIGSIYPDGPRKNLVMGLYSGCAPLGFFAGFLCAGALPEDQLHWYFWIASILACTTVITAFLSVPHDRTDRRRLGLRMDWTGAFLIMVGLILVAYSLAVEPYANKFDPSRNGFVYPMVTAPFVSGMICLGAAFYVEGWYADCPLLPFDFFIPKGVKAFSFAALCFYASYGVWLYTSADMFQSPTGTTAAASGVHGIQLAMRYVPTAAGGLLLCVIGGGLLHVIPIMVLLLVSGVAWIVAPLLLVIGPLPLNYWAYVLPSMVCATLGIDLTFTISIVFFSSVQPPQYQGLSGAMCSVLVNLAMSFSLPISEIVTEQARGGMVAGGAALALEGGKYNWGFQAAFIYAAASACLGLMTCCLFVRISRCVVSGEAEPSGREGGSTAPSFTQCQDGNCTV